MSGHRYFQWGVSPTFLAHLFKAVFKQHHQELKPELARLLPRDGVVLDVGAHAGQFTKLFAGLVPDGLVVAFEPGSYARSILRLALWRNKIDNALVLPYGAGDGTSIQILNLPIKRKGSYRFGLSHLGGGEATGLVARDVVMITTIDQVVEALDLQKVCFLKADIEGWELRMLHGASKTIDRFRPALMLELNPSLLGRAGDSIEAAHAFLAERGYVLARQAGLELRQDHLREELWLPTELVQKTEGADAKALEMA